jgi:CubicO group peptidase (beta-lactamase class C family)
MRFIFAAFFSLFLFNFCFAQTTSQKLDDYFSAVADNKEINGNLLIAENGKVIYKRSFGYADFETKRLNAENSEFNLASVSKTFTAVAVLQLKEKGKLSLDDKFVKYFPEFPYPEITIRQMLSHSSGLSDSDLSGIFNKPAAKTPEKISTDAELIPLIARAKVPLKLQPGEKWWYCNLAYRLLAILVEKVSGETFNDYLSKHIFQPAKMKNTYLKTSLLNRADSPQFSQNFDYPFKFSLERVKFVGTRSYYNEASFGYSNIVGTTSDLLRFDAALYNGTLLKNETLEEAFSPTKLRSGEDNRIWLNMGGMGSALNGLGWFIFEDASAGKIVWHTGGMPGCATIFLRNITKKQTVVLLDNTNSEGLYRRALSAMNILNGKPILPVKKSLTKIYGRALMEKGADYAAVRLNELKNDTENYNFSENDVNNMAYEMLENDYPAQALETFKLNTFLFPASDNVYESYGEGLLQIGKRDEAVRMFEKTLKINPQNEDAQKMLEKMKSGDAKNNPPK